MPDWILPLVTLTGMEIVLGIDNIIFVAIVVAKLPAEQQARARLIGLSLALGLRLGLLLSIKWLMGLTAPLFTLPELVLLHELAAREVTLKDLILIAGGLFLVAKSTFEIHEKLEGAAAEHGPTA